MNNVQELAHWYAVLNECHAVLGVVQFHKKILQIVHAHVQNVS